MPMRPFSSTLIIMWKPRPGVPSSASAGSCITHRRLQPQVSIRHNFLGRLTVRSLYNMAHFALFGGNVPIPGEPVRRSLGISSKYQGGTGLAAAPWITSHTAKPPACYRFEY
jgi:hypothetical protein